MKISELTLEEREDISRLLAAGLSFGDIGKELDRDKSTVYREVSRLGMNRRTYRAIRAHNDALRKKEAQGRKNILATNARLRDYVFKKLRDRWSPMQIANIIRTDYADDITMRISHETIYSYVYVLPRGSLRKELLSCLRQERKYRRRKNKTSTETRGKLHDMLSIDERPAEVADRTVPGHWEGDLILGKHKRTALGTLVERTTRTVLLVPLAARDCTSVRKAYVKEMKKLPKQMALSLTYDQGKEMSEHAQFTIDTDIKVYFAHPGCPWERGTNENTNGLVRQFFPKGTEFDKVSRKEIKRVQKLLNTRPRQTLGWKTPIQEFNKLVAIKV